MTLFMESTIAVLIDSGTGTATANGRRNVWNSLGLNDARISARKNLMEIVGEADEDSDRECE
jgi:hypothetical protein